MARPRIAPLPGDAGLAERMVAAAERFAPPPFSPEALAEADTAARAGPTGRREDATGVELITLDPPGSLDLDQALGILPRPGGGWVLHYAIADTAAFVTAGGPLDRDLHARAVTVYSPGAVAPLHPVVLSHGAASLLPGQDRAALLWRFEVGADGSCELDRDVSVRRALVRSRARLDYPSAQRDLDAGTAQGSLALLPAIGSALATAGRCRGAVNLPEVEEEIVDDGPGSWRLVAKPGLACEDHNSELSLLTGRAAAALQLRGGTGLLRTLPVADVTDVDAVKALAGALGIPWSGTWQQVIGGLDPAHPHEAALITAAGRLLRGAGYRAFGPGLPGLPGDIAHAAIGGPYSHATAPLRRLADRHVGACALAALTGTAVPGSVRADLPGLPAVMSAGDHRAAGADRAAVDLLEAWLLSQRIGSVLDGVAVGPDQVQLAEPPARLRVKVGLTPGARVRMRVVSVDLTGETPAVVLTPAP